MNKGSKKYLSCIFGDLDKDDLPICLMSNYDLVQSDFKWCENCTRHTTRLDAVKMLKDKVKFK